MLFKIVKIPARFALFLYCRKLKITNRDFLSSKGPLLIASNHPNSFLDAIILATIFNKPIYSLARGDVFKNKFISKILYGINILPVYRISEGAENLNSNYDTFAKCREIFKQNGIVLIFSEGLCINEWKLRALKKGTARLAFSSWEEGIDLTVVPAGINYQSFSSFGKNVDLKFGNAFNWDDLERKTMDGNSMNSFNEKLKKELTTLVETVDSKDNESIQNKFAVKHSSIKKVALSVPSFIGKWAHAPLYIPIQKLSWEKAGKHDHYDSVLVGLLFLLYPFYLTVMASLVYLIWGSWYWLLTFVILPFFAWSFVQTKKQF